MEDLIKPQADGTHAILQQWGVEDGAVDVVGVQDDASSESASVGQAEVVGKGGMGSVLGLLARNRGRGKSLAPMKTTVADPEPYMDTGSPLAHAPEGAAVTSESTSAHGTPRRRH